MNQVVESLQEITLSLLSPPCLFVMEMGRKGGSLQLVLLKPFAV